MLGRCLSPPAVAADRKLVRASEKTSLFGPTSVARETRRRGRAAGADRGRVTTVDDDPVDAARDRALGRGRAAAADCGRDTGRRVSARGSVPDANAARV